MLLEKLEGIAIMEKHWPETKCPRILFHSVLENNCSLGIKKNQKHPQYQNRDCYVPDLNLKML